MKLKPHHECHISPHFVLFSTEGAQLSLVCRILSHLSLISPESLQICFVWSSSYHSSPFLALQSPPLSRSSLSLLSWLLVFTVADFQRVIVWERLPCLSGAQLSLCPSILSSLHCSVLPFPSSHLAELRGVRRLRAALRKSQERLGT